MTKRIRNSLVALIALASTASAGIEVLGIEVLGIEVLGIEVLATEAPAGSQAEAIATVDGIDYVVATAPIDPNTGTATLHVPADAPITSLQIRGPSGVVLEEYEGPLLIP